MEPLVCFPDPAPPAVAAALRQCGADFRAVGSPELADVLEQTATKDGWAGAVVSAEELLEHVWDANADPFSNTVSVTMARLRRKLGDPAIIETVVGKGYRV